MISFERHRKSVSRMAYYYLSDKSESEKRLMFSIQMLNISDVDHNSSMKRDITKRLDSHVMVITTFDNSENWATYLQLMAETKVKSSIITFVGRFNQTQWESFISIADDMAKNSLFYVAFQKTNNASDEMIWYRIMTIHGNNKSIVNQMEFDSNGRLIEEYDMKGSIYSMDLPMRQINEIGKKAHDELSSIAGSQGRQGNLGGERQQA